jgi:hypothetical protein
MTNRWKRGGKKPGAIGDEEKETEDKSTKETVKENWQSFVFLLELTPGCENVNNDDRQEWINEKEERVIDSDAADLPFHAGEDILDDKEEIEKTDRIGESSGLRLLTPHLLTLNNKRKRLLQTYSSSGADVTLPGGGGRWRLRLGNKYPLHLSSDNKYPFTNLPYVKYYFCLVDILI